MSKHDIGIDGKKNYRRMPITTSEIATRLRDGETLEDIADSVGASVSGIYRRLLKGGYDTDGTVRRIPRPDNAEHHPLPAWLNPSADAPPCDGRGDLFTSPDLADHLQVRDACTGCPFAVDCAESLGPWSDGTYAGKLYRDGRPVKTPPTAERVVCPECARPVDQPARGQARKRHPYCARVAESRARVARVQRRRMSGAA